jgi:hypothetical protein
MARDMAATADPAGAHIRVMEARLKAQVALVVRLRQIGQDASEAMQRLAVNARRGMSDWDLQADMPRIQCHFREVPLAAFTNFKKQGPAAQAPRSVALLDEVSRVAPRTAFTRRRARRPGWP